MRQHATGAGLAGMAALIWMVLGSEVKAQVHIHIEAPASSAAEARLGEVATAYRNIGAYADQGMLELTYFKGGTSRTISAKVPLRFLRSERMVWDATVTGIAADKERVTLVNPDTTQPFTPIVATDFLGPLNVQPPTMVKLTAKAPDSEKIALLQTGGPTLLEILATLMTTPEAPRLIAQRSRWIRTWPYQFVFNNRYWWVVEIQPRVQAPPVGLWIDSGTNLVLWMVMKLKRGAGEEGDVGDAVLSWASGTIIANADRVRLDLEATMKRLLAQTRDAPPGVEPGIVAPEPIPPVPAPPGVEPGVVVTPPNMAPQAPSKAVPVPMLDAPGDKLPIIAVSLLIQQPAAQAPFAVTPRSSLWRIIYCRLYPENCKPVVVPAPLPVPSP